jgi:hypothetical protein
MSRDDTDHAFIVVKTNIARTDKPQFLGVYIGSRALLSACTSEMTFTMHWLTVDGRLPASGFQE